MNMKIGILSKVEHIGEHIDIDISMHENQEIKLTELMNN